MNSSSRSHNKCSFSHCSLPFEKVQSQWSWFFLSYQWVCSQASDHGDICLSSGGILLHWGPRWKFLQLGAHQSHPCPLNSRKDHHLKHTPSRLVCELQCRWPPRTKWYLDVVHFTWSQFLDPDWFWRLLGCIAFWKRSWSHRPTQICRCGGQVWFFQMLLHQ